MITCGSSTMGAHIVSEMMSILKWTTKMDGDYLRERNYYAEYAEVVVRT